MRIVSALVALAIPALLLPGCTGGTSSTKGSPASASDEASSAPSQSPTEVAHPGAIQAGLLGRHSHVLFQYEDHRFDRLWIMAADGTHTQMVEPPRNYIKPESMSDADVSPDGHSLVFTTHKEPVDDLWSLDLTTGRGRLLLNCLPRTCVEYTCPAYSPDGTEVAVTEFAAPTAPGGPPPSSRILILDLATAATRVVADSPKGTGIDHVRWSPDGSHLVLDVESPDAWWVATVPTDGSGTLTPITPRDMNAGAPDWSPAGDLIVFATWPKEHEPTLAEHSDLWTVHPDGSGVTRLLASDHGFMEAPGDRYDNPSFTLNGKGVLATWTHGMTPDGGWYQRRIVAVPLSGGNPILLTDYDGVGPAVDWGADGLGARPREMP